MQTEKLAGYLDSLLDHEAWQALDAAYDGLQVENSGEVEKVAFAVDAAVETVERAVERDADALVVHHGVVWGAIDRLAGVTYDRVKALVEADLALYASHLPLDAHPEVGNNALLLEAVDAESVGTFGDVGGRDVGRTGALAEPTEFDGFVERVEAAVGHGATTLEFGGDSVKKVAALTGSGADFLEDVPDDVDVFVSGEPKHKAHHVCRELGLNAVFAGHYHTETYGVRALKDVVSAEFDVETTWIDVPTTV
ncbi:MAG: Nif3-like dinuclear metal center hexameric protein [Halobacteriales archaeon]